MSPVGINGVDKQGVGINGVQVKQELDAANDTVDEGVYDATTLDAVDADLAEGNIKDGVNIFGKVGNVIPGGIETIEMYAEDELAAGGTYTPVDDGIFTLGSSVTPILRPEYLTGAPVWESMVTYNTAISAIGDGTNFRIKNASGGANDYQIMRHYITTGTYEVESSASLALETAYVPSDEGFFAMASNNKDVLFQQDLPNDGWTYCYVNYTAAYAPTTVLLGDGTELRIYNKSAGAQRWYCLMRAVMT